MQAVPTAASPIGVFDSGVGGLTVARTIVDQLPHESMVYIGDTANSPYGPKTAAEVVGHATAVADELVRRGCKMIVIACNTATSVFLETARQRYSIPVLGVIEPAVRRAMATTRNGKVGVIGTLGTVRSEAYQKTFERLGDMHCHAQACPAFVDFIERGVTSGRQILGVAQAYVEPLQAAGVDTLVLGCTHYPLLSGVIQLAMGDTVTLVSSAEETAKDVLRVLSTTDMLASPEEGREPTRSFESTGDPQVFAQLATRFLGPQLAQVSQLPQLPYS